MPLVEIKSFSGASLIFDLERAIGQFVLYRELLADKESDRTLYLAIPKHAFKDIVEEHLGRVDIVSEVETVTRGGELKLRAGGFFEPGYRHVTLPSDEWFVAARFELTSGARAQSEARIRELLKRRSETQPLRKRSCGSVFRNPPGDHAARLIEASGLKGERIGDAVVSEKHANFIINVDAARAADVEALIERVMARVERDHGVLLVPEVRVVGEGP